MAPRKGGQFSFLAALAAIFLLLAPPAFAQTTVPHEWLAATQMMRAQKPAAALPLLEALVRAHPEVAEYRIELAYALFLLGRDGRAKYHFEQARGAPLSNEQTQAVSTILTKIEQRKIWSVRLGFSIEPSSNAGRGTVASTVQVGDIVFPVPNSLRSKPATAAVLTAGVTVLPVIGTNLRATISLDMVGKYYKDKNLRETLFVGRAGVRWSTGPQSFLEGGVLIGRAFAGGVRNSDRYGVFAAYAAPLGPRGSGRIGLEHYRVIHESFAAADGPRTQISGNLSYALSSQSTVRARAFVLRTNAANALQAGWEGALTLGGSHAFKGVLVAQLDLTAGLDKRDGIGAFTGIARKDHSVALEAEFFNSNYQVGAFLPVLRVKHERNRSNIALRNYTNTSLSIGIRTSF